MSGWLVAMATRAMPYQSYLCKFYFTKATIGRSASPARTRRPAIYQDGERA